MFIIIHGDNQEKSSQLLHTETTNFKKNGYQVVNVGDDIKQLQKELEEKGLFETKKLLIIEGIKSLKEKYVRILSDKKYAKDISIVLYSAKTLTATQLKTFGKPDKLFVGAYPKLLWSFLDSFYPGNAKYSLKLLRDLVKNEAIELILFMLIRQLKDIYMTMSGLSSALPSWKVSKLKHVAAKYSLPLLKETISEIAEIDYRSKSSDADAKASLDFLIAKKLG